MKNIISASILSADFTKLGDQIKQCADAGVDWIHVDVMDGHFVPNITMGPFIVEAARKATNLPLDVHLMIEKPERHIASFINAGANYLTVQVETCPHLHRTLESIRELGCKSGVAVNPSTQVDFLPLVLPVLDLVLVMTVNPGFSGQTYIPGSEKKVKQVRNILDTFANPIHLEVDGGINSATLPQIIKAGADTFVTASAIFKHPAGIMSGVAELRSVMSV
jgi:ribulose-phosphate 3-epimerase